MVENDFVLKKMAELAEFCKKYHAEARRGKPIRQYRSPMRVRDLLAEFESDTPISATFETYSSPSVEITISDSHLDKLLANLAEIDSEEYNEYVSLRKAIGENFVLDMYNARQEQVKEEQMRKDNPGVQKAWENYQMMLKLAGK